MVFMVIFPRNRFWLHKSPRGNSHNSDYYFSGFSSYGGFANLLVNFTKMGKLYDAVAEDVTTAGFFGDQSRKIYRDYLFIKWSLAGLAGTFSRF